MTAIFKPLRHKNISSVLLPDGFLALYDLEGNKGVTLSTLGAIVWEYCDGSHQISEIIQELKNLLADECQEETVIELIEQLSNDGFLET
ncbi:MAG: PqqD family protein [Candidatus Obscuribacterales bacterium]|nr:PqqD family protein [Candidatus Obscuribacterales bacterium]